MPNAKKYCKDQERFRISRNAQRKRYYKKTAIYEPNPWTEEQDKCVLKHIITDTELSDLIGHSVQAIQLRRLRLKKAQKALEEGAI